MATASERPGSSDWSQLEQSFFDTAPPDVAVTPPPPATFDDLGPVLPERRKVRRPVLPRHAPAARPVTRIARVRWALATARAWLIAVLGALGHRGRRVLTRLDAAVARVRPLLARVRPLLARVRPVLARARPALNRVRPTLARARAQADAAARDGWRRLTANARRAKETSKPALRAATSRFLDELPGERPDGRTILATLAVIVVLCGLSATVLGRGGARLAPAPPAASTSASVVGSTP